MKKKILVFVFAIVLFIGVFFTCYTNSSDAIKFKKEYESLNNKETKSGKKYRKITIPKDNPFIYKTEDAIVDMINNKESFVVYFGFDTCPWCRSILPTLINVLKDLKLEKVYYVDIKNIRDTIEMVDENNFKTSKKGTEGYYKLLKLLDNVLDDYTLSVGENDIKLGEKRIYAPNIVVINEGVAVSLTTGISNLQTDGYMTLTEEMKKDTYVQLKETLKLFNQNACSVGC